MSDYKFEKLAADTVRVLSAEAIQKAKSGHPGMPMGCADFAFSLFFQLEFLTIPIFVDLLLPK